MSETVFAPRHFSDALKLLNSHTLRSQADIDEYIKIGEVLSLVRSFDSTPNCIHSRWLLRLILQNPDVGLKNLQVGEDGRNQVRNLLAEFEATKHGLKPQDRDIFRYSSIEELAAKLAEKRPLRFKASRRYLKELDIHECLLDTLVHSSAASTGNRMNSAISVHRPRSVEDVIVLTGSTRFDKREWGLYERLCSIGEVLIFMSDFGPLIGANAPRHQSGYLIDATGERACFESALDLHKDVTWETAPEILTWMIQIDPKLPFDIGMSDPEAYAIALQQFPWVLAEDRTLPSEIQSVLQLRPDWRDLSAYDESPF